jgi:hypothetical protein
MLGASGRWAGLRVAVLLVNYNQWGLARESLDSVLGSRGVDVLPLMVDNASRTPPPDWIGEYPDLRFRRLETNTGFAQGNNEAFSLADPSESDYTFLINTDAVASPDTIALLAGFLDRNADVGIAAAPIFYSGDPCKVWSAGGRFFRLRVLFDQRFNTKREELPTLPMECDFASGCALMVRTGLYHRLGGLHPGYFMYWEDAEFCLRARKQGYRVFLVPRADVLHHVASCSGGSNSPVAIYYPFRNRFIIAGSVLNSAERGLFRLYATAVVIAKTLLYTGTGLTGLVPVLWKAYIDGLFGRTGFRLLPARSPGPSAARTG